MDLDLEGDMSINLLLTEGGWDGEYLDEILEFDVLTGEWELVDRMMEAREWHAVSGIDFNLVRDFCQ